MVASDLLHRMENAEGLAPTRRTVLMAALLGAIGCDNKPAETPKEAADADMKKTEGSKDYMRQLHSRKGKGR